MPIKRITETADLIDWFADKLIEQEPQGKIPDKLVDLFRSFVDALKSDGATDGVMQRENLIKVLGGSRRLVKGSLRLSDFLADCDCLAFHGAEFGHDHAVPAFFFFASQHLGIDGLLMSSDENGNVRSAPTFEDREKITIQVTGTDLYVKGRLL